MTETSYPPGARIEVRDAEWIVRTCAQLASDGDTPRYKITAVGASEFVRDEDAVFFSDLDDVSLLKPEETVLEQDATPRFAQSRLFIEAVLRRTPLPQTEKGLALADGFLLDPLAYQRRPAELALKGLRPRILIADVVGLGKTLEIGLTLAELIRRGRGERILVVTPQQVLEQFQHELWTRFAIPLIRLDSVGIERIQREIPAGRNPFTHYKRIIVSIDTLKNAGKYGQHLEKMDWDAVVIDESHNLIGESSLRNKLARLLARRTDALLLASATPHNGDSASFAELIRMLDPAAIADDSRYSAKDIEHLYIRRTKINPEVRDQMGAKWPDRGPSVPVRCAATPAEEKVFAELTQVWLAGDQRAGGPVVDAKHRLFPYTLLKAFLSSHRALAKTVGNRLKNATEPREIEALKTLADLTAQMTDDDSAKLDALVRVLRDEIGVRKGGETRAVVFSESVETVRWLAKVLPERLKLPDNAVDMMLGNGMSDQKQQEIIEGFGLSDSPVRLLVTTDVTSEGVNLHRQCHHLVHYDVPWSLIRIEQRNGRIDRYGQTREPQFRALILTSGVEGAKDDRTVAEKLLDKEETAHRSLGTAEAVTGEYRAEREERRLIQDLLAGKTVEESLAEQAADDPFADLFGSVDGGVTSTDPPRADVPRLFEDSEAFVKEAVESLQLLKDLEDDGGMLAFTPPPDLVHRLSALPIDYLRTHDVRRRMRVTFDRGLARRKLDEARTTKTMWPQIAYLSDLHPMVEWVTDKVLVRLGRQKAPVVTARVDEPVFLVQGIYSNRLGQPTVVEWMAVTSTGVLDRKMTEVLAEAGVGPKMINTGRPIDLRPLQERVPQAVATARAHLEERRAAYERRVVEPLDSYRGRLDEWKQLTLDGVHVSQRGRREKSVDETVERQQDLLRSLKITGEPLLRVLAVLVPQDVC
ncbi:helicase [Planomonospora parontospora subsp. parontospora]|uniref:Helicase n=2 Tax=Planomonospora parontospora TaxID=58119 RepID=A0AA37BFZ7_9ACTN|nr:DEAD/DEAH box helicase [Planomonospora parontospora]GGK65723.1 helicase [Planomonospora parontospora]GII08395.1 helicase [Planomonospora parontospora subsp. parontospora]